MSRIVPKEQKKFDTNSKPLLEMIWKEILCLENTWRMNRYDDVMGRDKDSLLGELVDYNQDSVKSGG